MLQVRNPDAFQESVVQAAEPTVVMFWATWCPFCRRFKQEFEKLAAARPWRFAAVYLDDEDNPLSEDYAVDVLPTLALFPGGEGVARLDRNLGFWIDPKKVHEFARPVPPLLAL